MCVFLPTVRLDLEKPILWYTTIFYVALHTILTQNVLEVNCVFPQTGPDGATEEEWGVNYRALNNLFLFSQHREGTFTYEISVQMIEIYNEQIRDLLTSDGTPQKYPF